MLSAQRSCADLGDLALDSLICYLQPSIVLIKLSIRAQTGFLLLG